MVEQCRQALRRVKAIPPADGLGCIRRERPREDRQLREQLPGGFRQQVIAPLERRGQRLLTVGQAGKAAGALHALIEPLQHLLRREQPHPPGRELQRQGKTIQPTAQLSRRRRVPVRQSEPGTHIAHAVDKQAHRGCLRQSSRIGAGRRYGQRVHPPLLLAADPQHHPAGDQHVQPGRPLQQVSHHRRGIEHLLKVVEHDQHAAAAQAPPESVQRPLPALPGEAERRGNGLRHQPGVGDRRQINERDAVRPVRPAGVQHGQRQPRLAHPAGTGQHHQPAFLRAQQADDLANVAVPAHQRGDR